MSTPEEDLRLEYETSGEEFWSVEKWPELSAAYDLRAGELTAWHDHQSGKDRTWELIRRIYQVAPLVGNLTADDLRPWTREELAAKFSISLSLIEEELAAAVESWKQRRAQTSAIQNSEALSQTEYESLTRFSTANQIGTEMIDGLLKSFNFDHIKSPTFRAEIADRIISLKTELSVANTRTMAREVIRMEVAMHMLEKMLVGYQNQIDDLIEKGPLKSTNYKSDLNEFEVKVNKVNEELRKIATAHSAMLKTLGVEEIDLTAKKKIYVETATYLMEECRRYETDPEQWKLDSIFTAKEIDWLMTPVTMPSGLRDPQYRPDISIRAAEALKPENLWNQDYVPTPIARRVSEELARMVKNIRSLSASGKDDEEELPISDDDLEDEDGELPGSALESMPVPSASAPATSPGYSGPTRKSSQAPSIGVY